MKAKVILLLGVILVSFSAPLFAQSSELLLKPDSRSLSLNILFSRFFIDSRDPQMFERWFNSRVVTPQRKESKEKLREEWQEFLGIDVFYPYFKAKEVERFVQNRTKVDFFNFRGRAEFEEGSSSVRYIFRKKF